jgi:toxin ParE1/3/4
MLVRLSDAAQADLAEVIEYLDAHAPEYLASTLVRLQEALQLLSKFPEIGRPGTHVDAREWSLSPAPYIVEYSLVDEIIWVDSIRHAAKRWPPVPDEE